MKHCFYMLEICIKTSFMCSRHSGYVAVCAQHSTAKSFIHNVVITLKLSVEYIF
jgi:hypothetical protein